MIKTTLSVITMMVIGMSGLNAGVNIAINENEGKKGVVVEAEEPTMVTPTPSTSGYDDTIIYARGAKDIYEVGEEIRVQLKIKRDAYIYFWTISNSGKGYLILPNDFESFNKYERRVEYVVPNNGSDYSFVSDREGIENVYILATNKKIKLDTIENIFDSKSGGIVPTATSKSIKNFVTKDIQVIAKKERMKYDIAYFSLNIENKRRVESTQSTINININR